MEVKTYGHKTSEREIFAEPLPTNKELDIAVQKILDEINPYKYKQTKIPGLSYKTIDEVIKDTANSIYDRFNVIVRRLGKIKDIEGRVGTSGSKQKNKKEPKIPNTDLLQQETKALNQEYDLLTQRLTTLVAYALAYIFDHHPSEYNTKRTEIWNSLQHIGAVKSIENGKVIFSSDALEKHYRFLRWIDKDYVDLCRPIITSAVSALSAYFKHEEIKTFVEHIGEIFDKFMANAYLNFWTKMATIDDEGEKSKWCLFFASQLNMIRASVSYKDVATLGIVYPLDFYIEDDTTVAIGTKLYNFVVVLNEFIKSTKVTIDVDRDGKFKSNTWVRGLCMSSLQTFFDNFNGNIENKLKMSKDAAKYNKLPKELSHREMFVKSQQTTEEEKQTEEDEPNVFEPSGTPEISTPIIDTVSPLYQSFIVGTESKRVNTGVILELNEYNNFNLDLILEKKDAENFMKYTKFPKEDSIKTKIARVLDIQRIVFSPFKVMDRDAKAASFPLVGFSTIVEHKFGNDFTYIKRPNERSHPRNLIWCIYHTVGTYNCISIGVKAHETINVSISDSNVFIETNAYSGNIYTFADGVINANIDNKQMTTSGLTLLERTLATLTKECSDNIHESKSEEHIDASEALSDGQNESIVFDAWRDMFDEPIVREFAYIETLPERSEHVMFSTQFSDVIASINKNFEGTRNYNPSERGDEFKRLRRQGINPFKIVVPTSKDEKEKVVDLTPYIADYGVVTTKINKEMVSIDAYKSGSTETDEYIKYLKTIYVTFDRMFHTLIAQRNATVTVERERFKILKLDVSTADKYLAELLQKYTMKYTTEEAVKKYKEFRNEKVFEPLKKMLIKTQPMRSLTRRLLMSLKIYKLWVEYSLKYYIDMLDTFVDKLESFIFRQATIRVFHHHFSVWIKARKSNETIVDFYNTLYSTTEEFLLKLEETKFVRFYSKNNAKITADVMKEKIHKNMLKSMESNSVITSQDDFNVYVPIFIEKGLHVGEKMSSTYYDPEILEQIINVKLDFMDDIAKNSLNIDFQRFMCLDIKSMKIFKTMLQWFLTVADKRNKPETLGYSVFDLYKLVNYK